MLLAITAQRAHVLGFLAEGDTQWRVWRQGFVGKLAGGLRPTSSCETSIWMCTTRATPGDWKSWRMGCSFSEEPNWQWTPPLSAFFGEMGLQEQGQREGTVLRWQLEDVQKSGVTLNWWGDARGRGWLCWLWRWGDDGHQKHRSFCPSWRELEHVLKGGSSVEERRWHGGYVGGLCWRAQWHGQWPHRFWNFRRLLGPTVRHPRSMRLRGMWQVSSGDGPLA